MYLALCFLCSSHWIVLEQHVSSMGRSALLGYFDLGNKKHEALIFYAGPPRVHRTFKTPAIKPFATTWLISLLDWRSWRLRWRKWQSRATAKRQGARAPADPCVGATVIRVWFLAMWTEARPSSHVNPEVDICTWFDCQRLNVINCKQTNRSPYIDGRWICLDGLYFKLTMCPLLYYLVIVHWDLLFRQSSTKVRNILGLGMKCELAYRKGFPRPTSYSHEIIQASHSSYFQFKPIICTLVGPLVP